MPDETARRHPATTQLLRWFAYDHLRPGTPRDVSRLHFDLAHTLVRVLPDGPELSAGLRKLLEAKDCHVRAAIDALGPEPAPAAPAVRVADGGKPCTCEAWRVPDLDHSATCPAAGGADRGRC